MTDSQAEADWIRWLKAMPNRQDLDYELRKAAAIRKWCLRALDYTVGDPVEIQRDLCRDPTSGWWPYRECLKAGATGVVHGIDFNMYSHGGEGGWQAEVKLDREWAYSSSGTRFWHGSVDDTPEGYEPPSRYDIEHRPEGRRHIFNIGVDSLRLVP